MLTEKYINPFTDFGFKKIFGEELNKDLLKDFLNELLREEQGNIVDLQYIKSEQLGDTAIDRKAIFDIYCENEKGEKFIVELQKTKQKFFKDRTLYYATFPIREQAKIMNWDFELKAVYCVAILDFVFDEDKNDKDKYLYKVKLQDIDTNITFYEKLSFYYLEMPKFTKTIDQLETRFDKWLYVFKNLSQLEKIPDKIKEKLFEKLFKVAEIAKYTYSEYMAYEGSLKYYRDLNNSFNTATEDGFEKGMRKGMEKGKEMMAIEIAIEMMDNNIDLKIISNATKISIEKLKELKKHKK